MAKYSTIIEHDRIIASVNGKTLGIRHKDIAFEAVEDIPGVPAVPPTLGDCYYTIANPPNYTDTGLESDMVHDVSQSLMGALSVNDDVSKVYAAMGDRIIYEFNITGTDISTTTLSGTSSIVHDGMILHICFANSGSKLYVTIYDFSDPYFIEYDLSTPWDITTMSEANRILWPYDTTPWGMVINSTGDTIYAIDQYATGNNSTIYRFTLSTPWDITSMVISDSTAIYTPNVLGKPEINRNGDQMYFYNRDGNGGVEVFDIATSWGPTSEFTVNTNLKYSSPISIGAFSFAHDLSNMYVCDNSSTDLTKQWSLDTEEVCEETDPGSPEIPATPGDPAEFTLFVNGLNLDDTTAVYLHGTDGMFTEAPILVDGVNSLETGIAVQFTIVSEYSIIINNIGPSVVGDIDCIIVKDNLLNRLTLNYDYGDHLTHILN